jgi:alpha-galactosidase/6-phospho-beta-glucosidase family protein
MKIVLIGAGSFVFGPSVLSQLVLENDLGVFELALVDVDGEIVEAMRSAGEQIARALGRSITLTAHTDWNTALAHADYVICSVVAQGRRRFQMDIDIIERLAPGHAASEFGGVTGISYSLRQMAMIRSLTESMKAQCPQAWLLNVSNPLPRVCQAAQENGITTIGFCSMALYAHSTVWQLWGGAPLQYPFSAAHDRWDLVTAGCNHFAWVVNLTERATGHDALAEIPQRIAAGSTCGEPRIDKIASETGYMLSANDEHVSDFLPPDASFHHSSEIFHGDTLERKERLELLRSVGAGETHWDKLPLRQSWERPGDLIAARLKAEPTYFPALNLPNHGQMPDLPQDVFVETPCLVSSSGIQPLEIHLPPSVQPMTQLTVQVTQAIVRAATDLRKETVYHAIDLDPTIADKASARQAIDACLVAQADLLPVYA